MFNVFFGVVQFLSGVISFNIYIFSGVIFNSVVHFFNSAICVSGFLFFIVILFFFGVVCFSGAFCFSVGVCFGGYVCFSVGVYLSGVLELFFLELYCLQWCCFL